VQISTNSGATWTPTSLSVYPVYQGRTIAASADGKIVAVASQDNGVYVSMDGGATWAQRAGSPICTSIACSTNGMKMVGVNQPDRIYTSTDAGTNWTARDSVRPWHDIASSADGTKLVAVAGGILSSHDQIYTSTDSGTNWTARASAQYWTGVASSADGTKLVAVTSFDTATPAPDYEGQIYTSADSGTNWTQHSGTAAPNVNWLSVASSADGSHLVAASYPSTIEPPLICTSTNFGTSWQLAYAPLANWACVASSADGTKLVAVAAPSSPAGIFPTGVFTYAMPSTNAPTLNIATTGDSASLSWPWPSDGFALQQNTNLATTNWVNVATAPTVVNQVITTPTNAGNFYRLVKP
jgi:hypothetical protein